MRLNQALKTLRSAEYAPYVVFIAAPCLQTMQDYDGSLEKLARESDALKQVFFTLNFTTHLLFILIHIQHYILGFRQGFKDEDLGNSPGWSAATVATYCSSRMVKLTRQINVSPADLPT